ncbi:MAG: Glycerophosphoryl diester phosphodiesterase family protein [Mucilaginibacter sp.]|nr:Glycerophosphoryl diester phosphodiesterase family protein [Mucilaginibacter sp.]
MQAASFCLKHLKLVLLPLLLFVAFKSYSQNIPLINAFAHNDYWHKRPLYDALDNGYTHIEADIYLRHGKLVVAHLLPLFKRHRTLERLYLDPLAAYINGSNGQAPHMVYPVMLMIDIKSEANKTYAALSAVLEKYKSILSGYEDGVFIQRQITIVITGHKPFEILKSQQNRLAFIDEDLLKVQQDTLATNVYQTASCKYSKIINWNGNGIFPSLQKKRLCHYVDMAHRYGKKVRLWASPENPAVWNELLDCGVDLINTDKLPELKNFLTRRIAFSANVK